MLGGCTKLAFQHAQKKIFLRRTVRTLTYGSQQHLYNYSEFGRFFGLGGGVVVMGLGRQDLHPQHANSHYHTAVPNTLMPPRPFPSALRLGTDICNVSRIRAMLARGKELPHVHKFTQKILTAPERAYFWNRFGPPEDILTKLDTASNFLAGRQAKSFSIRNIT
jgi:hypothetical protein